jgi:hypothetical protein
MTNYKNAAYKLIERPGGCECRSSHLGKHIALTKLFNEVDFQFGYILPARVKFEAGDQM